MIAPAVPGWIVLIFLALYALVGLVALGIVIRFASGLARLVTRDDAASWRETTLLAGIILIASATYWISSADARASNNKLDSILEVSELGVDGFTKRRVDPDRPCGGFSAQGPVFAANEGTILEAMAIDADRFEADGWNVQRLVNAPGRRATAYLEFSPWHFTARRDPLRVVVNVNNDRYSMQIFDSDCAEPDFTAETVQAFPDVPDSEAAPSATRITELVAASGARDVRRSDISFPLVHGLGVDVDCFVASGTWRIWTQSERRSLITSIADVLELDGWTVQREAQTNISVNPDARFVARRGDEVLDGVTSRDGLTITEFPTGCATIGLHPRPLRHFELVTEFPKLSD